jgi:hypothetical protein
MFDIKRRIAGIGLAQRTDAQGDFAGRCALVSRRGRSVHGKPVQRTGSGGRTTGPSSSAVCCDAGAGIGGGGRTVACCAGMIGAGA